MNSQFNMYGNHPTTNQQDLLGRSGHGLRRLPRLPGCCTWAVDDFWSQGMLHRFSSYWAYPVLPLLPFWAFHNLEVPRNGWFFLGKIPLTLMIWNLHVLHVIKVDIFTHVVVSRGDLHFQANSFWLEILVMPMAWSLYGLARASPAQILLFTCFDRFRFFPVFPGGIRHLLGSTVLF